MIVPATSFLLHGTAPAHAWERTLNSLLGQTDQDFEVLIAGHGLAAEIITLITLFGDPRIRFMPDLAGCRAAMSGASLAILEAGDIWHPQALQKMRAALNVEPGAASILCRGVLFGGLLRRPPPPANAPPLATRLIRANRLPANTPLHDAAHVATALPGIAPRLHEDLVFLNDPQKDPSPLKPPPPVDLLGYRFTPQLPAPGQPPCLFVVVDTEAEFNWEKPFSRDLTAVSAIARLQDGQEVFEAFGVRPIYLIDYPVAAQEQSVAVIRKILDRRAAVIGAHLHPWTTPPFNEDLNPRLSFPGNLPRDIEAQKLDYLYDTIERSFSLKTPFYKAGRYGIGPNTIDLITKRGALVDFSLLPHTNLSNQGGPDFRKFHPGSYRAEGRNLLAVTMTRGFCGSLAQIGDFARVMDKNWIFPRLMRAALARGKMLERVTLTPEGMSAADQIHLITTLFLRGHRQFVLHYHSPSLAPGNTPYVRNAQQRAAFLQNMRDVCGFFFHELGGLPGRPQDFLPPGARAR